MGNWEIKVKSTKKLGHKGPRSGVQLEDVSGSTTVRLLLMSHPWHTWDFNANIWCLSVYIAVSLHTERPPGWQRVKEAKWVRVLFGKQVQLLPRRGSDVTQTCLPCIRWGGTQSTSHGSWCVVSTQNSPSPVLGFLLGLLASINPCLTRSSHTQLSL